YEPLCRDAHARVDWTKPAGTLHDLIRGCDPQPGAYTGADASQLRLYESRRVEDDGVAAPGTIVASDVAGVVVAAGGGAVRFGKARVEGTREKKPAAEVLATLGIGVGARLA